MNPRNLFAELKRHKVYKVAAAYAIVGWLLIQVATQVFSFFEIPNWAVQLTVLVLVVGFPIALVFAWAFELTPEGIKLTESRIASLYPVIRRRMGRPAMAATGTVRLQSQIGRVLGVEGRVPTTKRRHVDNVSAKTSNWLLNGCLTQDHGALENVLQLSYVVGSTDWTRKRTARFLPRLLRNS